jgi:hypothetical protein
VRRRQRDGDESPCTSCLRGDSHRRAVRKLPGGRGSLLTGFPEGHPTDYDKAVDTPEHILMWVELGLVALFLALAFFRFGARARVVGLLAATTVFVLVVVVQLLGVPWYFGSHLGLDNGIGG